MAALRSFGSWSSLCIKASSASNYLHNTTVQRRYAQGVVQSASFLMQQRERKRKRDNKKKKPKINQWIYKNIPGNLKLRSTYTDWPSVFTGPQSYNPATIPVLFRMGRMKHNKYGQDRPKGAIGNIELSKIPTFFHLAPPAIERHCQALKSLCTEWPSNLDQSSVPLRVTTKNYLFAGPSLHHPGSRVVKLQVYLRDLVLDDHARKKLIELVEDRYDPETDELTIVTDRCPTRKQNRDYAMYLLSVLYHESWKTEPWEAEANKEEAESDDEDEEEIMQWKKKPKKPRPLKLINGELYRVNKFGKYFKLFINEKD